MMRLRQYCVAKSKRFCVLLFLVAGSVACFCTPSPLHGRTKRVPLYAMADDDTRRNVARPSKSDLYPEEELKKLLGLHTNLVASEPGFISGRDDAIGEESREVVQPSAPDVVPPPPLSSIHDLVVSATATTTTPDDNYQVVDQMPRYLDRFVIKFDSSIPVDNLAEVAARVKAIASDVDGTLLSSSHTLHPRTREAIEKAVEASFSPIHPLQIFFLATGKTRQGALRSLGLEQLLDQVPGVFIQGLYCVDEKGTVVFEKKLPREVVRETEALAAEFKATVLGYDGDELWASRWSDVQLVEDVAKKYGEPRPVVVNDSLAAHEPSFHKMLFINDDIEWLVHTLRPRLEELADKLDCVVTRSVPNMLEILPSGCSKGAGVEKLCQHLGLSLSTDVCAIGDAENDLELLQNAAIGVAVGNAASKVKDTADVVMRRNNNENGAGEAIMMFGLGGLQEQLRSEQT